MGQLLTVCSVAVGLHLRWLPLPCSVRFVQGLTVSCGLHGTEMGLWARWFSVGG